MHCTERSFLGSRGLVLASVVAAAASISACTSLRTGAGDALVSWSWDARGHGRVVRHGIDWD